MTNNVHCERQTSAGQADDLALMASNAKCKVNNAKVKMEAEEER